MSEYVYLQGSEQVSQAGREIARAADEMRQVVLNFDGSLERQQRFMDDWLMRFEAAVERLATLKESPHP